MLPDPPTNFFRFPDHINKTRRNKPNTLIMKSYSMTLCLAAVAADLIVAHAEVRFLAHGHTDLALDYDAPAKTWNFHVGSDTLGEEFAPDEVILKVKPGAQTTVPTDAKFSFLGAAGSPIWIL